MAKSDPEDELSGFGRFSEPALLILISLAGGPKHGYAMTEDIAASTGVKLGPGTLYGALARLESKGLIELLATEDKRRIPYRLTAAGEESLRVQLAAMRAMTRLVEGRLADA